MHDVALPEIDDEVMRERRTRKYPASLTVVSMPRVDGERTSTTITGLGAIIAPLATARRN